MNSIEQPTAPTGVLLHPVVRARRFTTRSSAHGSDYVPLSNPERYEMTREEAEADVSFWKSFADSVGGDAIVVECPNNQAEAAATRDLGKPETL